MSNSENIQSIPLQAIHESLGAKMVPFAGYLMPVRYSSDLDEHHTVRNAVGLFDVSHMGEFVLKGPKALEVIQQLTTNDASVLVDGKIQYSALTNEKGGIIDDLLVYRIAADHYYIVVNASNIEKDKNWIVQHLPSEGAVFQDISSSTCLFALQGPHAGEVLSRLTQYPVKDMVYYTCAITTVAGFENILISATGYTGAGGFEIYVPNEHAEFVWNALMQEGAAWGLKPIGLGARDTLRLEMGYCLYGNDITDDTNPIEAGLGWITKFSKKFTASDFIQSIKEKGAERKLVGFEMIERGIPRGHYEVYDAEGLKKIGEVTSGTQSPTLSKGIGMAYVDIQHAKAGTPITIQIRDKKLKALVVQLPFVKK
jgi:aminomethyltransferase